MTDISALINDANGLIAGLTGLGTAGGGAVVVLWRVSRWFAKLDRSLDDLRREIGVIRTAVGVRETDHAKLEGKIEMQQATMMKIVASLQQATGSLDALWR